MSDHREISRANKT